MWAGISTALALVGIAVAGRPRRKITDPQRLKEGPTRVFTEVSRFAQELAHEVRNPLTAINARLYKLQKKLPEGSPEYRDAMIIETEIKRLDQMLETFRKLGCQAKPHSVPFRLDNLLEEISELFAAELEPQGIQLACEQLPAVQVEADPQQIKQVLINLIKNAAESILQGNREPAMAHAASHGSKGHPSRGLINIRLHQEVAPLNGEPRPAAIVEVEDDGPGIAEPVRSRLLEPFFSTKEHGTGLGLPIAARIIAQHGGALEFQNRAEQGTIFRVLLPMEVPS